MAAKKYRKQGYYARITGKRGEYQIWARPMLLRK